MNDFSERFAFDSENHIIEFFETILHVLLDGLLITDHGQNIVLVNDAFCSFFGKSTNDMLETNLFVWLDEFCPNGSKQWADLESTVVREHSCHDIEFQLIGGGNVRDVAVNAFLVESRHVNTPGFIVSIWHDLTNLKQMKIMQDKAREADNLKSIFLANMSHEIRTPLNAIIGFTDIMLREDLPPEHRRYHENMRNSGNLLLSLLNDILDLSKVEAGRLTIERQPFFLESVFDNIESTLKILNTMQQKDIVLRKNLPQNICKVIEGDANRIQQVMNNLISNAVKFTETGSIEFGVVLHNTGTSDEDVMLKFYVQDTGVGIPMESQSEVFLPFQQLEEGRTRKHGGTGLGLSISKELAELMGGEMDLQTRTGHDHGSIFSFTIPYKPCREPERADVLKTEKRQYLDSPKVLIVEDNLPNQLVLRALMEKAGFVVQVADDGKKGVAKYESDGDFRLIMMDIRMPVMDGLEATRSIRQMESKEEGKKRIPIIALTASTAKENEEAALSAGHDYFLTKPVDRIKLFDILDELNFKSL